VNAIKLIVCVAVQTKFGPAKTKLVGSIVKIINFIFVNIKTPVKFEGDRSLKKKIVNKILGTSEGVTERSLVLGKKLKEIHLCSKLLYAY
jgi:hypothetical protein